MARKRNRRGLSRSMLRRRAPQKSIKERFLIVCEGEQTERVYFEAFTAHTGLTSADVVVAVDCGSSPINVAKYAKRLAESAGPPDDGGYDFVYCVFDRDSHETYEKAMNFIAEASKSRKIGAKVFSAVESIPCIEYWFILHFQYTRSPIVDASGKSCGQKTCDLLKKHEEFKSYDKKFSNEQLALLLNNTDAAIRNAIRAQTDAINTSEPNPSTRIHELICSIKQATKK